MFACVCSSVLGWSELFVPVAFAPPAGASCAFMQRHRRQINERSTNVATRHITRNPQIKIARKRKEGFRSYKPKQTITKSSRMMRNILVKRTRQWIVSSSMIESALDAKLATRLTGRLPKSAKDIGPGYASPSWPLFFLKLPESMLMILFAEGMLGMPKCC